MHTNTTPSPELLAVRQQLKLHRLHLKLTMLRVQIKALETLERLMDDPEPTGNEKKDRFEATKRNRQRLAANQTLIHCRTADRECRLAKTNRQATKKQKGLEPNRASDGSQAPEKKNPTPPSPLAGVGGRASGRMRGRSESSDDLNETTSGFAADPSPQPSPAHFKDGGEGDSYAAEGGPNSSTTRVQWHTTVRPKRSRYKTRKPKHPSRSRKRKR